VLGDGVLDEAVLRALGGVASLSELEPADWTAVLETLDPVGDPVPVRDAIAVWQGLAATAIAADPAERAALLDPLPDRLPALHAGEVAVADADAVVVAAGHRWAQLGPVLPAAPTAAAALADLLDLPVAAEHAVVDDGIAHPLDPRIAGLDARLPAVWHHHDALRVQRQAVRFWVDDGEVHAVDQDSLADALADLLTAPHLAALLREALGDPSRAQALWATVAWSDPPRAEGLRGALPPRPQQAEAAQREP
jgi:hypothetical protein